MSGKPLALSASLAALALCGCPGSSKYPGAELIGTFGFAAAPFSVDCSAYSDPTDNLPDGGFQFAATFSRAPGASDVWVTLSGISTQGQFDGQYLTWTSSAPRSFVECTTFNLVESMRVAVFSQSQSDVVGGQCPSNPLDGGLPAPGARLLSDGGIVQAPGSGPNGFDAVLACGVLSDLLQAPPDSGCAACGWLSSLSGARQ